MYGNCIRVHTHSTHTRMHTHLVPRRDVVDLGSCHDLHILVMHRGDGVAVQGNKHGLRRALHRRVTTQHEHHITISSRVTRLKGGCDELTIESADARTVENAAVTL